MRGVGQGADAQLLLAVSSLGFVVRGAHAPPTRLSFHHEDAIKGCYLFHTDAVYFVLLAAAAQPVEAVFARVDNAVIERIAKIMSYIKTGAGGWFCLYVF